MNKPGVEHEELNDTPAGDNGASAAAISHHYDVGNDFYRLWLDNRMNYSCAHWDGADSLEAAQLNKIHHHLRQAGVKAGDRVLDIGCGWGHALELLTSDYDVAEAVGLTLSGEQVEWIEAQGRERTRVHLQSWADFEPDVPFDAIISLGVLPHFCRTELTTAEKIAVFRRFFECCHRWLKPGGQIAFHCLFAGHLPADPESQLPSKAFLLNEIFPESDIIPLSAVLSGSESLFEVKKVSCHTDDYRRTCREWLNRLRNRRSEAIAVAGIEVVERYEFFLRLAVMAFEIRSVSEYSVTLERIAPPSFAPQAR